ncbi:MAG: fluoride efflux transporter CrcB, partial [Woeseiaceae bacterium]
LFVAAGGALGAMARYGLNVVLQRDYEFPYGTFAANVLGCLAMGIIAQLVAQSEWFNASGVIPDQYRLLFAVGFCGSFTTLSALVFEVNVLVERSEVYTALGYMLATLVGGFVCFFAGMLMTRALISA